MKYQKMIDITWNWIQQYVYAIIINEKTPMAKFSRKIDGQQFIYINYETTKDGDLKFIEVSQVALLKLIQRLFYDFKHDNLTKERMFKKLIGLNIQFVATCKCGQEYLESSNKHNCDKCQKHVTKIKQRIKNEAKPEKLGGKPLTQKEEKYILNRQFGGCRGDKPFNPNRFIPLPKPGVTREQHGKQQTKEYIEHALYVENLNDNKKKTNPTPNKYGPYYDYEKHKSWNLLTMYAQQHWHMSEVIFPSIKPPRKLNETENDAYEKIEKCFVDCDKRRKKRN